MDFVEILSRRRREAILLLAGPQGLYKVQVDFVGDVKQSVNDHGCIHTCLHIILL